MWKVFFISCNSLLLTPEETVDAETLPTGCCPIRYMNTCCQQSGYCCLAKQQPIWRGNLQNLMFLRHTGWLAVRQQHTHCFHSLSQPTTQRAAFFYSFLQICCSVFSWLRWWWVPSVLFCTALASFNSPSPREKSSFTNSKATSAQLMCSDEKLIVSAACAFHSS